MSPVTAMSVMKTLLLFHGHLYQPTVIYHTIGLYGKFLQYFHFFILPAGLRSYHLLLIILRTYKGRGVDKFKDKDKVFF